MEQNTKQTQKIQISFDADLARKIKAGINYYLPALKTVRIAYEALERGPMYESTFASLMTSDELIRAYMKSQRQEIETAGITGLGIEALLAPTNELVAKLEKSIRRAKNVKNEDYTTCKVELSDIYFDEATGAFKLSLEKAEIINAFCSQYLETDSEKDLFDLAVKVCEAYARFRIEAITFGINSNLPFSDLQNIVKPSNEGFSVLPEKLKGLMTFAFRKAEHEKEAAAYRAEMRMVTSDYTNADKSTENPISVMYRQEGGTYKPERQ